MLKNQYYDAVQLKYPRASLARAIYKVDKDFTEKTKLDYLSFTKSDLSKYLITVHYSNCYYFETLKVNSEDNNLKIKLLGTTKQRKGKLLDLKQTLIYGELALHLMFELQNSYHFNEIIKDYFTKWRPYLWEKVELLLD